MNLSSLLVKVDLNRARAVSHGGAFAADGAGKHGRREVRGVRVARCDGRVCLGGGLLLLRGAPRGRVFEGYVPARANRCFARSAPLCFQLEVHADAEPMG